MKKVSILFVVVILLTASVASASIWIRPTTSGAGLWSDAANWDVGVPGTGDVVTIVGQNANNLAEAQVTGTQTFGDRLRLGNNSVGGVIRVMSGGTLASGPGGTRSYIGDDYSGKLIIDSGGTFTHKHRLYVGDSAGTIGELVISGTVDLTSGGDKGHLWVGNNGVGLVDILDGGVLNMALIGNLKFTGAAGSKLDLLTGGKIVFDGAVKNGANGLLPSIYGNGVLNSPDFEVNVIDIGGGLFETVITVPEPATMLLLGLGGLLLRKRRNS